MHARNTTTRYGWVFWTLHWSSVLLFLLMLMLGLSIGGMDDEAMRASFTARHVSFAYLFLAVMVARLLWRFVNPNPIEGYAISPMRKQLARVVQLAIHGTVLLVSLLGMAAAAGLGLGGAPAALMAQVAPANAAGLHAGLSNLLYLFVVGHLLAAASHLLARPPESLSGGTKD